MLMNLTNIYEDQPRTLTLTGMNSDLNVSGTAQDSTGAAARHLLKPHVDEYMKHFLQGREPAYAGLHHPLSSHQGLPLLPLPWTQFAGVLEDFCTDFILHAISQ